MIRLLAVSVVSSLLMACSVSVKVPQYEAAAGFVQQIIEAQQAQTDEREFLWTARLDEEGRLLRVHTEQGLFVFVSSEGDAIAFDGWQVRSFAGFGVPDLVSFVGTGPEFQFVSGMTRSTVKCGAWELTKASSGASVWRQPCDDISANEITLNEVGAIVAIRHAADSKGTQLILQKLPPKQ